jgi:LuxR family maltose regulon positive regulatory protein
MVRCYQSKGQWEQAMRLLRQYYQIAENRGLVRLKACLLHEQVRQLVREGDLQGGWDKFNRANAPQQLQGGNDGEVLSRSRDWLRLAQARLLCADGKGDAALLLLEPLVKNYSQQGRSLRLLEVQLIYAGLLSQQGKIDQTLKQLEGALSAEEVALQLHVDEASQLLALYRKLEQAAASPRVRERAVGVVQLIGAVKCDEPDSRQANPTKDLAENQLVEPLTKREIEVLQLVADGLSNKDVAERLFLSIDTIKTHLRSIFSKMAVSRRTQAVNLGRELQLIA